MNRLFCVIGIIVALASPALGAAATRIMKPGTEFTCIKEKSISLDVDLFRRAPGNYLNDCVFARGYVVNGYFYEDLEHFYQLAGNFYDNDNIGLYLKPGVGIPYSIRERFYGELVARAYNCGGLGETGPCEVSRGAPVLFVSEWRPIKGAPTRLFGPEAQTKYGSMDDLADDARFAAPIKSYFRNWFAAIARRDEQKLLALQYDEDIRESIRNTPYFDEYWQRLFSENSSPYRFLFGRPPPAVHILMKRTGSPDNEGEGAYLFQSFGCVCKTESCDYQWPISADDAVASSLIDND